MEINFADHELRELRRIYCLWWHYLRQSFWYRKFCEIMHEAGIEATGKKGDLFDKAAVIFESIYKNGSKLNQPPDLWVLNSYWDFFGHVHLVKFGEWWEKKRDLIAKDFIIDLRDPIAAASLFIFEAATRRYCRDYPNSFPTTENMLDLVTRDHDYIYTAIPLWNLTIGEIGQQIAAIREKYREKQTEKTLRGNPLMLTNRKQIKHLARYLKYFKMENQYGLSKRQMIDKRQKLNNEKADHEIKDEINSDISRAKKIIKNIEMGKFPGPYQPDDK